MGLLSSINYQSTAPIADGGVTSSDPSTWQAVKYAAPYDPWDSTPKQNTAYYDPVSGNLYNSQDPNAGIVANKDALNLYGGIASNTAQNMLQGENGSYIDPSNNTHTEYSLNRDPSKIQQDYQLYQSDPNSYYGQLASALSNTGSDQVHDITGMANSQYKNLESIKNVNPLAYWNARLQDSAAAAGFQTGHNGQANPAFDAQLQSDYLAAKNAGLPQQQLDNIIKNVYIQGITSSAQQVAQQDRGGAWKGIAPVVGLALAGLTAGSSLGLTEGALAADAASVAPEIAGSGFYTGTGFGAEGLGAAASSQIASNATTEAMINFANASPDPIQALTELQSMTPSELSAALGPGAGEGLTAKDILSYANKARQALGIGNNLAKALNGGATNGGTTSGVANPNAKALANILNPSSTGATNFSQINMNQQPFLQAQQPTSIQSSAVQPTDFLAQLNQQEKQPTMADLLRTRIA